MMRTIMLMLAMVLFASQAPAQFLPGLGSSASSSSASGIDTTIQRARDAGIGVIIVDTEGRVLNEPAPPQTSSGAATNNSSVLMTLQKRGEVLRTTLNERLEALPGSLHQLAFVLRATSPDGRIMTYVETAALSVFVLFFGFLFSRFVYGPYLARHIIVPRIRRDPAGYREKMPFLILRFFMGVIGVIIAILVAYILGRAFLPPITDLSVRTTVLAVNFAFFVSLFVANMWRMVLSPYLTQYRIPPLSDAGAKKLYRWLVFVGIIDISILTFTYWLKDFGLIYNAYAVIAAAMALLTAVLNVALVLFNFRIISTAIRGGHAPEDVAWITRVMARLWAPALIIYAISGWIRVTADLVLERPETVPPVAGFYGIVLSVIVVYGLINYGIENYFERTRRIAQINTAEPDDTAELPIDASDAAAGNESASHTDKETELADTTAQAPLPGIHTYEQLAHQVSVVLAFVAGIYALTQIWQPRIVFEMADGGFDRVLDVVVILFIGWIIYHIFRIWVDNKIADETDDSEDAGQGDEGSAHSSASRLATLLPLFRGFILAVIVVTIILIVLLELGVNVSPLFAGAGIVGVAIGFGSQTLVRDIFSGAFFLFDDAFRRGEYIDTGGVKGTVEKISVRSFQLRHHLGPLHTIPFGEIQVLTNYSRDWVIMKLPLRVTYDTDVENVRKLIKKLGKTLLEDPVIGKDFIEPLKSQGVIEMQDSAMIIRVKFMTKPGDQWVIRKKVYGEIRALFEREGIKFAHRQVTVRIADDQQHLPDEQKKRAALAAAQADMEEDDEQGGMSADDR